MSSLAPLLFSLDQSPKINTSLAEGSMSSRRKVVDTLYLQELKYWSTMSFFDGYPPDDDAQLSSPVYTTRGVTIDNNNNLANENNKTY